MCNSLCITTKRTTWVPVQCHDLQLRLCVIARKGPGGYRSVTYMGMVVCKNFFLEDSVWNIKSFVRTCLYCFSAVEERKLRGPFGLVFYKTPANYLLQFYYIYLDPVRLKTRTNLCVTTKWPVTSGILRLWTSMPETLFDPSWSVHLRLRSPSASCPTIWHTFLPIQHISLSIALRYLIASRSLIAHGTKELCKLSKRSLSRLSGLIYPSVRYDMRNVLMSGCCCKVQLRKHHVHSVTTFVRLSCWRAWSQPCSSQFLCGQRWKNSFRLTSQSANMHSAFFNWIRKEQYPICLYRLQWRAIALNPFNMLCVNRSRRK